MNYVVDWEPFSADPFRTHDFIVFPATWNEFRVICILSTVCLMSLQCNYFKLSNLFKLFDCIYSEFKIPKMIPLIICQCDSFCAYDSLSSNLIRFKWRFLAVFSRRKFSSVQNCYPHFAVDTFIFVNCFNRFYSFPSLSSSLLFTIMKRFPLNVNVLYWAFQLEIVHHLVMLMHGDDLS